MCQHESRADSSKSTTFCRRSSATSPSARQAKQLSSCVRTLVRPMSPLVFASELQSCRLLTRRVKGPQQGGSAQPFCPTGTFTGVAEGVFYFSNLKQNVTIEETLCVERCEHVATCKRPTRCFGQSLTCCFQKHIVFCPVSRRRRDAGPTVCWLACTQWWRRQASGRAQPSSACPSSCCAPATSRRSSTPARPAGLPKSVSPRALRIKLLKPTQAGLMWCRTRCLSIPCSCQCHVPVTHG